MSLTQSQEQVLQRLNEQRMANHEAAKREADAKGLRHPPEPELLTENQVEYPKYLHKDWKASDKAPGHHIAGKSRLVHDAKEEDEARREGFSSDGPKAAEKTPSIKK